MTTRGDRQMSAHSSAILEMELDAWVSRFAALTLIVVVGWLSFLVVNLIHGRMITVAIDGVAAGLTLALRFGALRHRSERVLRAYGHATIAVSVIGLALAAMLSGQSQSMAPWYIGAAPIWAAYQHGARAGLVWAVLAALLGSALMLSELVLVVTPEFVPSAVDKAVGVSALAVIVLGFGWASRRTNDRQLQALRDHEAAMLLQQELLAQARDEALAAARLRSAFMANMSHEIRTPLNGILGMTEVLASSQLKETQRRALTTIARSGRVLLDIVNDILDFSKIEAGRLELERRPLDLHRLVADVVDMLAEEARHKGVRLSSALSEEVPRFVVGDSTRLRQVLLNLVGNAVKFTQEGEVVVRVSVARSEGEGDTLCLAVEDTGIGIPEEQQARIFEPFSQADTSTTRRFGGSGLGLAISGRLVRMMGGSIDLESAPGKGSVFTVRTPMAEAAGADVEGEGFRLDPELGAKHPLTILVAEDIEVNREVILGILSRMGYHADVAQNGREAVQAVIDKRYDLVLMDLQMPELDGLTATRRIRRMLDEDRQPRIVALTANVLPDQRAACRVAGMDGFVPKPIRVASLTRALLEAAGVPLVGDPEASSGPGTDPLTNLKAAVGHNEEVLARLVRSHVDNGRELLETMRAQLSEGELEAIERGGHSLKSSAAMFGSEDVAKLAAALERAAAEGREADVAARLEELDAAFELATTRLEVAIAGPDEVKRLA